MFKLRRPSSLSDIETPATHVLPEINKKQRNGGFNLDDFNSDEKGPDVDQKKKNERSDSHKPVVPIKKSNTSNMLNTSDNIKDIEDLGNLKHRTMTGMENKVGAKRLNTVKPENEEEVGGNQTKSLQKDEKEENHEEIDKEDKEVEVK